ncbi:hypothetical protein OAH12_02360 [Cyclobacteriaceae bacterium]|nr:hypothetical protein [Cyclobacteriaceae bacterium]
MNIFKTFAIISVLLLFACSDQVEKETSQLISNDSIVDNRDSVSKPSLQIVKNVIDCQSRKFKIKINEVRDGSYQYQCWNLPLTKDSPADLEIWNGELSLLGSQGGVAFTFNNNEFKYVIESKPKVSVEDSEGVQLMVYENSKQIVSSRLYKHGVEGIKDALLFVSKNWSYLYSSADLSPSKTHSALPDVGIRGKYAVLHNELGISILENILEEKVYLAGGHKDSINLNTMYQYGRYNPKFLNRLEEVLRELLEDKAFVSETQDFYDRRFARYLQTYYLTYGLSANKESSMYKIQQYDYWKDAIGEGYDLFEWPTCLAFWGRRTIDGTSNQFYDLLVLMIKKYDADFLDRNEVPKSDLLHDSIRKSRNENPVYGIDYEGCSG